MELQEQVTQKNQQIVVPQSEQAPGQQETDRLADFVSLASGQAPTVILSEGHNLEKGGCSSKIKKKKSRDIASAKTNSSSQHLLSQATRKHVQDLDSLCQKYQLMIDADRHCDVIANETVKQEMEQQQKMSKAQKTLTQRQVRAGLDLQQIEIKKQRKADVKREQDFQEMTDQIYQDEWRTAAFPKMFAMPANEVKETLKKSQKENASFWKEMIDTKNELKVEELQQTQKHFQKAVEQFEQEYAERERAEQQHQTNVKDNFVSGLDKTMKVKNVEKRVGNEIKILEREILFGDKAHLEKPRPDNSDGFIADPNFNKIIFYQRKKAEKRAQMHAHNLGPDHCLLCEMDPMPELPQDHVLWGIPAMDKPNNSSYSNTYQDPAVVLARRAELRKIIEQEQLKDYLLDKKFHEEQLEKQVPDEQVASDQEFEVVQDADDNNRSLSPNPLNSERKLIDAVFDDQDQKPDDYQQRGSMDGKTLAQALAEDCGKSSAMRSSLSRRSHAVSVTPSQRSRCTSLSKRKQTRTQNEIFETQSNSKTNLRVDRQSQRQNRELFKKTKKDIDALSETDSHYIRHKITDHMLKNQEKPSSNDHDMVDDTIKSLAHTKAQKMAVERMIGRVSSDVITAKRIAEEKRRQEQAEKAIEKQKAEQYKRKIQRNQHLLVSQIIQRKRAELESKQMDREIPHIEGNMGYPPRYHPSQDELRDLQKTTQSLLRNDLNHQINIECAQMLANNERENEIDKFYLSEFREIEKKADFKHTSGNMGKIGTCSLQEIRDLKKQEMKMPKVWDKAIRVKNLQDRFSSQSKLHGVTVEKLPAAMATVGSELQGLLTKFDDLPQARQTMKTQIQNPKDDLRLQSLTPNDSGAGKSTKASENAPAAALSNKEDFENDSVKQQDTARLIERLHSKIQPRASKTPQRPQTSVHNQSTRSIRNESVQSANKIQLFGNNTNQQESEWKRLVQETSEQQTKDNLNLIHQMEATQKKRSLAKRSAAQLSRARNRTTTQSAVKKGSQYGAISTRGSIAIETPKYPWEVRAAEESMAQVY